MDVIRGRSTVGGWIALLAAGDQGKSGDKHLAVTATLMTSAIVLAAVSILLPPYTEITRSKNPVISVLSVHRSLIPPAVKAHNPKPTADFYHSSQQNYTKTTKTTHSAIKI